MKKKYKPRTISVAPMLDWTDRHCRYFHRKITRHTWLYTEMVTTGAILHGNVQRHLDFNEEEHPLALQLGGSEPEELAQCAKFGEKWGYDEINLNCGCPSERVQKGAFGACLMSEADLVANCVKAMRDAVGTEISVKHRIGTDENESYGFVRDFIGKVSQAGCGIFIVHARNAILKGLSPKENRDIPPLRHEIVYKLKKDFPDLEIIINGGITTTEQIDVHLKHVDGVMIGREAYQNPYFMAEFDSRYFGDSSEKTTREEIIESLIPYFQKQLALYGRKKEEENRGGLRLKSITRHLLGLFHGQKGARIFRRYLSDAKNLEDDNPEILLEVLGLIKESG